MQECNRIKQSYFLLDNCFVLQNKREVRIIVVKQSKNILSPYIMPIVYYWN